MYETERLKEAWEKFSKESDQYTTELWKFPDKSSAEINSPERQKLLDAVWKATLEISKIHDKAYKMVDKFEEEMVALKRQSRATFQQIEQLMKSLK